MTHKIVCWAAALTLSAITTINAQTNGISNPNELDVYILMGQSNMAGRGEVEPEDQSPNPRVLVFTTNETWLPATEPITRDPNKKHGVGPGLAFGKCMATNNPIRTVGLVPCAVGGTPLQRWEPDGDLYSNAVYRARAAAKYGTIKGFLWHQGESDTVEERARTYEARLSKMISTLRADLAATNAPFVVAQLGEFLFTRTNNPNQFAKQINQCLAELPSRIPLTGCVESKGLTHKGDGLHFDSASQREMGRRFAVRMQMLQDAARYPRVNLTPIFQVDPSWPTRSPDAPWAAVSGLEVDKQDRIWIYTRTDPTVQVYAPDGRCIKKWPKTNPKSIAHSIRIDRDGFVWLLDIGLHVARKHTTEGEPVLTIGAEGVPGEDETHFNKPTDIAFAPNGDLFISDGYGNNRIVHFTKSGKFIKSWGKLGIAPGEFSLPHAIVCDRHGHLYVADRNNGRVQVFDTDGKLLDVWSNIVVPWSLWLSPEGDIWTCGSSPMPWQFDPKYPNAPLSCPPKDQITVRFSTTGKVLQLWTFPKGEDGKEKPGELNWLHNVLLDSKGNMYCTDIIGKRLQKFVPQTNLTLSTGR